MHALDFLRFFRVYIIICHFGYIIYACCECDIVQNCKEFDRHITLARRSNDRSARKVAGLVVVTDDHPGDNRQPRQRELLRIRCRAYFKF